MGQQQVSVSNFSPVELATALNPVLTAQLNLYHSLENSGPISYWANTRSQSTIRNGVESLKGKCRIQPLYAWSYSLRHHLWILHYYHHEVEQEKHFMGCRSSSIVDGSVPTRSPHSQATRDSRVHPSFVAAEMLSYLLFYSNQLIPALSISVTISTPATLDTN